ncbi:MAG: PD-(D/E)XK nuclease family protein [Promethearchaeota archaeon]
MSEKYDSFSFKTPWLSKSSVLTYKWCPRKFYLKQVEDIDIPESDALRKGINFHEWIDGLYDRIDKEGLINGEKTIEEEYKNSFPEDFSLVDEEEIKLYDNFIEMEKERWESVENKKEFFPLKTEEFLKDEDLMYYGSFDRLDKYGEEDGEDIHIVMEYKTGNFKEHRMTDYRFQLAGYKHLIEKNYDKYNVEYMGIIFPKDKKTVIEKFKTVTINAFYNRVEKTRKKVLNREFDRNGYCAYCDLYNECYS